MLQWIYSEKTKQKIHKKKMKYKNSLTPKVIYHTPLLGLIVYSYQGVRNIVSIKKIAATRKTNQFSIFACFMEEGLLNQCWVSENYSILKNISNVCISLSDLSIYIYKCNGFCLWLINSSLGVVLICEKLHNFRCLHLNIW